MNSGECKGLLPRTVEQSSIQLPMTELQEQLYDPFHKERYWWMDVFREVRIRNTE